MWIITSTASTNLLSVVTGLFGSLISFFPSFTQKVKVNLQGIRGPVQCITLSSMFTQIS